MVVFSLFSVFCFGVIAGLPRTRLLHACHWHLCPPSGFPFPFSVCFVLLLAGERNLDFVYAPSSRQSKQVCFTLDLRSSVNLVNLFRFRREWLPRQPVLRFPLSVFRFPLSAFRSPLTSLPASCMLCRRRWRCGLCRCLTAVRSGRVTSWYRKRRPAMRRFPLR